MILLDAALWILCAAAALGLAVLCWEWLLHTVIVRRLRRHLARTGVRLVLAFPGRRDVGFLTRVGPEPSAHARIAQAAAEAPIERLLALYRQSVPAWCRQSLHP